MLLAGRDITAEDLMLKGASPTYRLFYFFLKTHGAENPDAYIEEFARDSLACLSKYALSFAPSMPFSKMTQYYSIGIRYIAGAA
ncbi:MAG: hypothetical protein P9L90_07170 [Candidatus Aadella gelida]|nr:hypothetical protein [Candidatus Aadella gelida]